MNDYRLWFEKVSGFAPHPWQADLGADPTCRNRLIRIPTGLGKTAGVVLSWLWNRVERGDDTWPRRLIFCLPMRVLVEQTEAELRNWLRAAGHEDVAVSTSMGGVDSGEWYLQPEQPQILVGTLDMLLTKALQRGFAVPRARWPMEFGLVNQDALWVFDEVQLMDVGLATSAQMQAFRDMLAHLSVRPCLTWWMSATLQRQWLRSVDSAAMVDELPELTVAPTDRQGSLWEVRKKALPAELISDSAAIAARVLELHGASTVSSWGRITLAVFNTVETATAVHQSLEKRRPPFDVRIVHSRFRGAERERWRESFLSRSACVEGVDRILISTQVVEAGVDISATTLVTELAPWPNLVQRFGRAARYGGTADVLVVDRSLDEKKALPYRIDELTAAARAYAQLTDVAPLHLETFEAALPAEERALLYPYEPLHLLTRRDLDELFDTTPDLTGADIDVSRFIRQGDERDVLVFWRKVEAATPDPTLQPSRRELCPVGLQQARKWLCGTDFPEAGPRKGVRAWSWSYLDGEWRMLKSRDLIPGAQILVDRATGGYHDDAGATDPRPRGFTANGDHRPEETTAATPRAVDEADAAEEGERLSDAVWKTIATHGLEVGDEAARLASALACGRESVLQLAGRWHDVGKSHPAFQACIAHPERPQRADLAKAPRDAWRSLAALYRISDDDVRRGFRHELASAMALFAVLRRCAPEHPALLRGSREALTALGYTAPAPEATPSQAEQEILALDGDSFDLLTYLVVSHHGKVRVSLHASPADQEYVSRDGLGPPIRGVRPGDRLPALPVATPVGEQAELPAMVLSLEPASLGLSRVTGPSWGDRVRRLVAREGVFRLAFLEALLRVADVRATRAPTGDPLLGANS